ncbi:methyl-accepting chemotaxis protein [Marinomonas sp. C2222]|uniref:Methyl-accepting chemotaxis protein n=1 Tax=Marinomonas sargassi TaxID=2984494 RepID=A0ABT2YUH5_9GAMM|nr:methyl-accepting chemotaxis protein [Marinomonas sargassi]MCV2403415.1 methyl-accepting chemotaxis protein [Marinomonas sargassi]
MFSYSLKRKISLLATSAVLLTSITLTFYSTKELSLAMEDGMQQRITSVSNAVSSNIESWVTNKYQILNALSEQPYEAAAFTSQLNMAISAGDFSSIYAGLQDGTRIGSNGMTRFVNNYDPRTRPWYKAVSASKAMELIGPYKDINSQEMTFTIAKPLTGSGSQSGVIGVDLRIKNLFSEVTNVDTGKNSQLFLLNSENDVIAHKNNAYIQKKVFELYDNFSEKSYISALKNGDYLTLESQAIKKILHFAPIKNSSWVLAIEVDQETEQAHFWRTFYAEILISIVITLAAIILMNWVMGVLFRDLFSLKAALNDIANGEGDLTRRININSHDEIGQVTKDFNRFTGNLHSIIQQMGKVAHGMAGQADALSASVLENRKSIQKQEQSTLEASLAVNSLNDSTALISSNVESTGQQISSTLALSEQGIQQMKSSQQSITHLAQKLSETNLVVAELNEQARGIAGIVSTIDDISEQTNLLALNAAIEAARAGEAGRGFAVVADEVRGLSSRTRTSTTEIQSMIVNIQQSSMNAVELIKDSTELASGSVNDADQAQEMINEIMAAIQEIESMTKVISSATLEQLRIGENITDKTNNIKSLANDLASQAIGTENQAEELNRLSTDLQKETNKFIV